MHDGRPSFDKCAPKFEGIDGGIDGGCNGHYSVAGLMPSRYSLTFKDGGTRYFDAYAIVNSGRSRSDHDVVWRRRWRMSHIQIMEGMVVDVWCCEVKK